MNSIADSKWWEQKKEHLKSKIKAASQKEHIHMWEEHFKNLLWNFPEVTNKPIAKIINCQLDIKLRQFTEEELNN